MTECATCGGSPRKDGSCGVCEAKAARRNQGRILGFDWIPFNEAAKRLGVPVKMLADKLRPFLTHKSASLKAHGARNVGYVYSRSDVACAQEIAKVLACSPRRACETLSAIRTLRRLGLLDHIEKQLSLNIEEST